MPNTKTQTALDFFIEELFKKIDYMQVPQKLIDQAKEMEKEQIVSAFNHGEFFTSDYYHPGSPSVDGSENYYIETYGGK
jgi:hypothetical protein